MSNTLCQYLSLLQTQHHHDYNSCMVSNDFNMSGRLLVENGVNHPWRSTTWASSWSPFSFQSHIKTLSFQSHIQSITKASFFHLKNISRLWQYLSDSVTETLIHSFISSRLDYCNGVLPICTGSRSNPASHTKSSCSPTNHFTAQPPSTSGIPSINTPHPELGGPVAWAPH